MYISRRVLSLLIIIGILVLLISCTSQNPLATSSEVLPASTKSEATLAQPAILPTGTSTLVKLPTASSTFTPTSTSTFTPTQQPSNTPSSTSTSVPTLASVSLVPGVYSGGGCLDYTLVKKTNYGWPWASFIWCVEYVEIHPDGSMIFVMSWNLYDYSEGLTAITKRSDVNNPKMYLTDNLGNRYDSIIVSDNGAGDLVMVKDVTYYGTFTFRPPKPGANRFTFHDDDNSKVITDILLIEPAVYIYDVELKWSPLSIRYYSDNWTASKTDQGELVLTHTTYNNCQVTEWEPEEAQGKYLNTIDIGTLKYDIFRTQEPDWSLREYVLVGGLETAGLTGTPLFHVTIPYDNSAACLEDVGSILSSVEPAAP
jgi:hypothetical protein